MNAKHGYYMLPLDKDCRDLTTFFLLIIIMFMFMPESTGNSIISTKEPDILIQRGYEVLYIIIFTFRAE